MNAEYFLEKAAPFAQTNDAKTLVGKRVLSKNGLVVGKVSQVRLDSANRSLEGLLVRRKLWQSKLYISHEFISRLTPKAAILDIDPVVVLRGRRVVSKDGKGYGRVSDVLRNQHSNELTALVVRRRLFWKKLVPAAAIKSVNSAIILDEVYADVKDAFGPAK